MHTEQLPIPATSRYAGRALGETQARTAHLKELFGVLVFSEEVQKESLKHGFRPGNPTVPIKFPESPFVQYQRFGLQIDLGTACEPPKPEVLSNLLGNAAHAQSAPPIGFWVTADGGERLLVGADSQCSFAATGAATWGGGGT